MYVTEDVPITPVTAPLVKGHYTSSTKTFFTAFKWYMAMLLDSNLKPEYNGCDWNFPRVAQNIDTFKLKHYNSNICFPNQWESCKDIFMFSS